MDPTSSPAQVTPAAAPAPAPTAPQLRYMLDKGGQLVRVGAPQVEAAQAQGYIPLTDAEAQHLDAVTKYGGRSLATGVFGAVDSATLGAAGALAAKTGLLSAEEQAGMAEANPTANTVGRTIGIIAPALATGGEAALAQGASGARAAAAALPSALVPRLGAAVGEAVAARGAGRVVAGAVRGAVETSLYAGSEALSEAAIQNKPLTAEALLASVGPAAVLGAVGGGALEKALGLVASKAPAALERASQGLERLAQRVEASGVEAKTGRVVAALEASNGAVAKGIEEASAVRRELVSAMLSQPAREEVAAAVTPLKAALARLAEDAPPVARRAMVALEREVVAAGTAAEQFGAFQRFAARTAPLAREGGTPAEVHKAAAAFLEDSAVWGKAADVQRDFAQRAGALDEARAAMREAFGSSARASSAIEGAGEGTRQGLAASRALKDYTERAKDLVAWATERAQDLPTGRRNVPQVAPLLEQLGAAHGEAVKAAAPSLLEKAESFLPHAVGGPLGTVGHLTRQSEAVAQVMGKAAKVLDHIKEGVAAAVDGTRSKAWAGSAAASWVAPGRGEARHETHARQAQMLAELRAQPQAALDRLQASTGQLGRQAPDTTGHAQLTSVRAVSYLAQAAPKVYGSTLPGSPKPQASAAETARYSRVTEAVMAPLGVLQLAQEGRVTLDHTQALQAVYPELHLELKRQVLQQVARSTAPIPIERQVQLSILIGEPIAPALRLLPTLQGSFAATEPAPQQGPAASSVRPTPIGSADRAGRTTP